MRVRADLLGARTRLAMVAARPVTFARSIRSASMLCTSRRFGGVTAAPTRHEREAVCRRRAEQGGSDLLNWRTA